LALDIEVDVMEASSENISLVGVPGLSSLEIEARLGCREAGKLGGNIEVTDDGVPLPAVGTSVFGVGRTLIVFGVFFASGDWTDGVGSGGNADAATADLTGVSDAAGVFTAGFEGTEIFKIPGVVRFSGSF